MTTDASPNSFPLSEVCLYMEDLTDALAYGEIIKNFGFTVYVFGSVKAATAHLGEHPLTACVFFDSPKVDIHEVIEKDYHGPVFRLPTNDALVVEFLSGKLREVHSNQMKIQNPAVVRVLSRLQRFFSDTNKSLLLTGSAEGLQVAAEYIQLFAGAEPVELNDLSRVDELVGAKWSIVRSLFQQPLAVQQKWALLSRASSTRFLVLEEGSLNDLDELYGTGKIDDVLYERLSLMTADCSPLAGYSVEELAVQPIEVLQPKVIFSQEKDQTSEAVITTAITQQAEKKAKGLLGIFFGRR